MPAGIVKMRNSVAALNARCTVSKLAPGPLMVKLPVISGKAVARLIVCTVHDALQRLSGQNGSRNLREQPRPSQVRPRHANRAAALALREDFHEGVLAQYCTSAKP